ncbi:MAG: sensor histidine kinase [Clostridiales bacterium]|nr:sensor histidine kinase [Clostridiales bacterium]
MTENKKTTSTAKKINRSWMGRLLLLLLLINLLTAVLLAASWGYQVEQGYGGLRAVTGRGIGYDEGLPLWEALDTVTYRFHAREHGWVTVDAGALLGVYKYAAAALLCAELLLWLLQYGPGLRSNRRLLHPLDEMARQTMQISAAGIDFARVHSLEDAISRISPEQPGVLRTGDSDLEGLERAINDLLTRMEAAYRQQARFVSDASHELRTPISVLQGYVDLLDRWGKDDPQVLDESITAIRGEVANMKQLIEQLLFLARGESGRTQLSLEAFSLSDLLREVYDESLMIDAEHPYRLEQTAPVTVTGDAAMLKQVARILVDNAAKYTLPGYGITLRSGHKGDGTPFFAVQDNGVGIAAGDLPQVFDRFFRADPARARQTGGTGLGLSIARWIVERHGGYFELLSREGIGTRVTVCLPQTGEQQAAGQAIRAAQGSAGGWA